MDAPTTPSHEVDVQGKIFSLDRTSIPLPFPQRVVQTSRKIEDVDKEILETFRKVEVNISLDVLNRFLDMPNFLRICAHIKAS